MSHLKKCLLLSIIAAVPLCASVGSAKEQGRIYTQVVPRKSENGALSAEQEQRIARVISRLGDDSWRVREAAQQELLTPGFVTIPYLMRYTNHADFEIAHRVRLAMDALGKQRQGNSGRPVEGLTLAAVQADPKPRPGEAVALRLKLTNTTPHDIYLYQYFWSLHLQPTHRRGTKHSRTIALSVKRAAPMDFLRLESDQSVEYLMDADPIDEAKGASKANAYLEIALASKAKEIAPKPVFSGSSELVSGLIRLEYAPRGGAADDGKALLDSYLQGQAGAKRKLLNAPNFVPIIQAGLRHPKANKRWDVFELACQQPRAALAANVVEFLARIGPRLRGSPLADRVNDFADGLPAKQRLPFLYRVAQVATYDWRQVSNIASQYIGSSDSTELDFAASVFLLLHERGDRRPPVLNFTARRLFRSPNPTFRDKRKAVELIQKLLKLEPNNIQYRFTSAKFQGGTLDIARLVENENDPSALNSLAWDLATALPAINRDPELAVRLAERAVELVGERRVYPYYADTLAAAYAASGQYPKAVMQQEKAIDRLRKGDRQIAGFARRLVHYVALAVAERDGFTGTLFGKIAFKGRKVRGALIERLRTESRPAVRKALVRELRTHFPQDPVVRQVLDQEQAGRNKTR